MSQKRPQSQSQFKAINLACGGKLCQQAGWINADHNPSMPEVMKVNLLRKLPFEDNTFDIVYHSQFIEHLPLKLGCVFLRECYRVLKPKGILRVVTPDLKNQAVEYLNTLNNVLLDPIDRQANLEYNWIRLEMLDQLTRQKPGGDMVEYLNEFGLQAQGYLRKRLGRSGDWMIPVTNTSRPSGALNIKRLISQFRDKIKYLIQILLPEELVVGKFRLSGEVHLCMYDEFLLSSVLKSSGFSEIKRLNANSSSIDGWANTFLDCDEHGNPDCPASLFMEAVKD